MQFKFKTIHNYSHCDLKDFSNLTLKDILIQLRRVNSEEQKYKLKMAILIDFG